MRPRSPLLAAVAASAALLAAACTSEPGADTTSRAVAADLGERPDVTPPAGDPPDELVVDDLVVGDGQVPQAGDLVTTRYVGVGFGSGTTFDASWDRGEPLRFRVGTGQVIEGWDLALLGDEQRDLAPMRVGGRRQVVVPPSLAYGDALVAGLTDPADTTLVFVIDLVAVG